MEDIVFEENFKWSPGDIKCLIDLFGENINEFDRAPKKKVWSRIAERLSSIRHKKVSGEQCDGKWIGLKIMYKKVKDNNNSCGKPNKKWEYFGIMHEILYKRPEINPPATCSSDNPDVTINNQSNSSRAGCSIDYDFVDCIIEESATSPPKPSVLKRRRKAGDEDKTKRHEEKMARQDRFLGLFEKLIDKM